MWSAKIFTLYPEFFPGILDIGLYKRARENKIWSLDVINIRDSALDKHGSVDDTPFGGGSGMVMRADVIDSCLDKNIKNSKNELIYLSPRGDPPSTTITVELDYTPPPLLPPRLNASLTHCCRFLSFCNKSSPDPDVDCPRWMQGPRGFADAHADSRLSMSV